MKKIVLGISGGVDSAVSAYILKNKGYDVVPLFCIMHDDYEESLSDAEKVCKSLDLEINVKDCRNDFNDIVIKNFISEYLEGRTPNPCIICNPYVKLKAICDYADIISCYEIATGHYSSIGYQNGRYFIKTVGNKKDQSYMLSCLPQNILKRLSFPLENMTKEQVRDIAYKAGISVYSKKDSLEICFTSDYKSFIDNKAGINTSGNFVLESGEILGRHNGIHKYTIGQRKGLGISYSSYLYVKRIDPITKDIILTDKDVFNASSVKCDNLVLQKGSDTDSFDALVKIRYAAVPVPAFITLSENGFTVSFKENQRAATMGQYAVVYDKGDIICSGRIININNTL